MNTCGICFLEGIDELEELNLKKFQQVHCQSDKNHVAVAVENQPKDTEEALSVETEE